MFSRSHSQQVAGWDANPMSWLPTLCFIVIKVPTVFVTSLGGLHEELSFQYNEDGSCSQLSLEPRMALLLSSTEIMSHFICY